MKKAEREKRASGTVKKVLIAISIILIAAALTLGILIAFNIGGMGIKVNNCLASLPVTRNFFKPIEAGKTPEQLEQERLEREKRQLQEERKQLEELSKNLEAWELQLKAKESELLEQQKAIQEMQKKLESRLESIQELAKYYERMEPEDAVKIIDNMADTQLVITVLKNMKQERASQILSLMEPGKAARIMEMMAPQQ